ncbi:MAG TPA: hypothetical protein VLK65_20085 [Vicinamibacteria bacterium]|nr:hypothetical protein [Vicinamibacteria bacterium]
MDRSAKIVRLSVKSSEKHVVLEREYRIDAGDLRWYSTWPERGDLRIIFFQYEDALATEERVFELRKVPRQVISLAFTHDETTGSFVEALAPAVVTEENARYDARENTRQISGIYFSDSVENEARILEAVAGLAINHDLSRKEMQAGLVGRLAEWSAEDFSLEVQRYESSQEIGVLLEDYGNRDLSRKIAEEVLVLPGIARTRHFVSVNFRLGLQSLNAILQVVEAIAKRHGLMEMQPQGMFGVARYGAEDLEVSVDYYELDGRIKVSLEDGGWHAEFSNVENALRSEFSH